MGKKFLALFLCFFTIVSMNPTPTLAAGDIEVVIPGEGDPTAPPLEPLTAPNVTTNIDKVLLPPRVVFESGSNRTISSKRSYIWFGKDPIGIGLKWEILRASGGRDEKFYEDRGDHATLRDYENKKVDPQSAMYLMMANCINPNPGSDNTIPYSTAYEQLLKGDWDSQILLSPQERNLLLKSYERYQSAVSLETGASQKWKISDTYKWNTFSAPLKSDFADKGPSGYLYLTQTMVFGEWTFPGYKPIAMRELELPRVASLQNWWPLNIYYSPYAETGTPRIHGYSMFRGGEDGGYLQTLLTPASKAYMRLATHFDRRNILFVKENGYQPTTVGKFDLMKNTEETTWRLAIHDAQRDTFKVTTNTAGNNLSCAVGERIRFDYTGATVGDMISVIINGPRGETYYYGQMAKVEKESGTVYVMVPKGLGKRDNLELRFYCEKTDNAKTYATSYASNPVCFNVSTQWSGDTVNLGSRIFDADDHLLHFGGNTWRVFSNSGVQSGITYQDSDDVPYDTRDNRELSLISEQSIEPTSSPGTLEQWQAIYLNRLSQAERNALLKTYREDAACTVDYVSFPAVSPGLNGDRVYFPSAEEMSDPQHGFNWSENRITNDPYWLRSKTADGRRGMIEQQHGTVQQAQSVDTTLCLKARPRINLNTTDILFRFEAKGGKVNLMNSGELKPIFKSDASEWGITLHDTTLDTFALQTTQVNGVMGDYIQIAYSGATAGSYITGLILDPQGLDVQYFGRLQTVTGESGTVSLAIPWGLREKSFELCLLNEKPGDGNLANYGSLLRKVQVNIQPVKAMAFANEETFRSRQHIYYGWEDQTPLQWRVISANDPTNATGYVEAASAEVVRGNVKSFFTYEAGVGIKPAVTYDKNTVYYKKAADILHLAAESYLKDPRHETRFDEGPLWFRYQKSGAQRWCTAFEEQQFSPAERDFLLRMVKSDADYSFRAAGAEGQSADVVANAGSNILNGDKVYFPSAEEAAAEGPLMAPDTRDWLLRSTYIVPGDAQIKFGNGFSYRKGTGTFSTMPVDTFKAARPSINLQTSSVLFISSAVDGKPTGKSFCEFSEPGRDVDGRWKLTLIDPERSLTIDRGERFGNKVTLTYSNAATGAMQYLSAVITSGDGKELISYSVLAALTQSSGTVGFSLPDGFDANGYRLQVFSEEKNFNYCTDFASKPQTILVGAPANQRSVVAGMGDGLISLGNFGSSPIKWRILSPDKGNSSELYCKAPAGEVKATNFGNYYWMDSASPGGFQPATYYDSTADYYKLGTEAAFLLSDSLLGTGPLGGLTLLDNARWNSGASKGYQWCTDFTKASFTQGERDALLHTVKSDALLEGMNPAIAHMLRGEQTFFLSFEEAITPLYGFTGESNRVASYQGAPAAWWVRSPYGDTNRASVITSEGAMDGGQRKEYPARPGLNLDLQRVFMSSAAAGGKSTEVGTLSQPALYAGSDWKLTLRDPAQTLKIDSAAYSGTDVTLTYSDAAVGAGQYVSAIVTDAAGEIQNYGKLASAATASSGSVTFPLPQDFFANNRRLRVFSEQCNGDGQTDYAGDDTLLTLTMPQIKVADLQLATMGQGYQHPKSQGVVLTNIGTNTAVVSQVALSGKDAANFTVSKQSECVLGPQDTNQTSFMITPKKGMSAGRYEAVITATYGGGLKETATLKLQVLGSGEASPSLTVADIKLPDQIPGYTPQEQGISMTNTGTAAAVIAGISLSGLDADCFQISGVIGSEVDAGDVNATLFKIAPISGLAPGVYDADLTVFYQNGATASASVHLAVRGTEQPNVQQLALREPSFAEESFGYAPLQPQMLTLTNNGEAPIKVTRVSLAGADAQKFTLYNPSGAVKEVTINPHESDSQTWAIVPAQGLSVGEYGADILVLYNNGRMANGRVTFKVTAVQAALLQASRPVFALAYEGYTPPQQSIALKNLGQTAARVTEVTLRGAHAESFELLGAEALKQGSIAPGATLQDALFIRPKAGLSVGSYDADIDVTYDGKTATVSTRFTVRALVVEILMPRFELSTPVLADRTEGAADPQTATSDIFNAGKAAGTILGAALSGKNANQFVLEGADALKNVVLAPGSTSKGLTIRPIDGITAGEYEATVTVDYTDGGSNFSAEAPIRVFVYQAVGDQPIILTAPAFAPVSQGYVRPQAKEFALYNRALSSVDITELTLGGAHAGCFEVAAFSSLSVGPRGTAFYAIRPLDGLSEGRYTATLTATYGGGKTVAADICFTVGPDAAAEAMLALDALELGEAEVGYSSLSQTMRITNSGNADATVVGLRLSGANASDFIIQGPIGNAKILKQSTDASTYRIAPKDGLMPGVYTARLTLDCNAGKSAAADISFKVNGGSGATVTVSARPSGSVALGTQVTLTALAHNIPSPSYQWYCGAQNDPGKSKEIAGAISPSYAPPTTAAGTLYYYCLVNGAFLSKGTAVTVMQATHVVTFDSQGGSLVGPMTVGSGSALPKPSDPAKANYQFAGWFRDAAFQTPWDFAADRVVQDVTLFAKWTQSGGGIPGGLPGSGGLPDAALYQVCYHGNNGFEEADVSEEGIPRGRAVTAKQGTLFRAPVGHIFAGWSETPKGAPRYHGGEVFEMPNRNLELYAVWEAFKPTLNGKDHVAYLYGYENNLVKPLAPITREEAAMVFYRLLDAETRGNYQSETNDFADVEPQRWSNLVISTLANAGIIRGKSEELFDPRAPITRAELVTMLTRFVDRAGGGAAAFTDISGHWAEKQIIMATKLYWIFGYADQTFRPDALITRAETAVMINRVLHRSVTSVEDMLPGMKQWADNQDVLTWYYFDVQEASNSHQYSRNEDGITEKWLAG